MSLIDTAFFFCTSHEKHIEYLSKVMQVSLCKRTGTTVMTPHQSRNTYEQLGKYISEYSLVNNHPSNQKQAEKRRRECFDHAGEQ